MTRTDSRSLVERKVSVTLRIVELRKALGEAERAQAEIEIALQAEAGRRSCEAAE